MNFTQYTLALILPLISLISCENIKKQPFDGKVYKAELSATCKTFADGGCMTYSYGIVQFEKDTVHISKKRITECTPRERESQLGNSEEQFSISYSWAISNDTITIDGFNDYGQLILVNNQLIGVSKHNKELLFNAIELNQ